MIKTIKGVFIVLAFAVFIFGPWYFFKNPFDAAYCLMMGNEWATQGKNKRYCKETYSDFDRLCQRNSECQSKKCVIGFYDGTNLKLEAYDDKGNPIMQDKVPLGSFGAILSGNVMGKCSRHNQDPCYSREVIIDEKRNIIKPSLCD